MIDSLGAALQTVDFSLAGSAVTRAEWMAAVMGLVMVVCNARLNPMGWVLAMSSSALYGIVFLQSRLYGQAGLQVLFVLMAAWGLGQWLRAGRVAALTDSGALGDEGRLDDAARLKPQALSARHRQGALWATALLWLMLGLLLHHTTDNPVPYADALPTAGSVVATWLLAHRYPENWLAWLGVNLVCVGLFTHQGLWPTAALYAVFAALSVWGWLTWRRQVA